MTWRTGGREAVAARLEIAARTRRARAVLCDIQTQGASSDFPSMQLFDGLFGVLLRREPDEREASRPSRFAVFRNVHIHDLPNLSEQLAKLFVRRSEVEVPYEYLA